MDIVSRILSPKLVGTGPTDGIGKTSINILGDFNLAGGKDDASIVAVFLDHLFRDRPRFDTLTVTPMLDFASGH